MHRTALYPGSFDPITNGHMDIILRSVHLFDRLIVAIGLRQGKTDLFTVEERIDMIRDEIDGVVRPNGCEIEVISFDGLSVDAARNHGAKIIVRGLRDATDFDYEMRMASMNTTMARDVRTVFLPASPEVGHVASSLIRQIASMGEDVSPFVPPKVARLLALKYAVSSIDR